MGTNTANVEMVYDYSTQQPCVRLHVDLPLHPTQWQKVKQLMDATDYAQAFQLVRQSSRDANYEIVDAFESALAEIGKSQRKIA